MDHLTTLQGTPTSEREAALRSIDAHIAQSPVETAGAATYADLDARRNARRERLISLADAYAELDHAWPDAAAYAIEHDSRERASLAVPSAPNQSRPWAPAYATAVLAGALLGVAGMRAVGAGYTYPLDASAIAFGAACGALTGCTVQRRRARLAYGMAMGAAIYSLGFGAVEMLLGFWYGPVFPDFTLILSRMPQLCLVGAACGAATVLLGQFGKSSRRMSAQ